MKILITSDTHLGYKESNTLRSSDSFLTFSEVLSIARSRKVDLILHSGDLFDIGTPTRYTMNVCIHLLRTYLLGPEKSQLKSNKLLNYDDPNYSISIPLIGIHGNHDGPSGLGSISPMDILHGTRLINYIGKISNVDSITIDPIVFTEENVSIYGLGYLSDSTIQRALESKRVIFKEGVGYKILLLHQNRYPIYKSFIDADLFGDFFDLIVYGHEHDPIQLKNNFGSTVLQCGSTLRTSLCENELGEKYTYILDTVSRDIEKIPLLTVRKFYHRTLDLRGLADEETQLSKVEDEFKTLLKEHGSYTPSDELREYIKQYEEVLYCSLSEEIYLLPLIRIRLHLDCILLKSHFDHFTPSLANTDPILFIKSKREKSKYVDYKEESLFNNEYADILYESLDLKVIPEKYVIEAFLHQRPKVFEGIYDRIITRYKKMDIYEGKEVQRIKKELNSEDLKSVYENPQLNK